MITTQLINYQHDFRLNCKTYAQTYKKFLLKVKVKLHCLKLFDIYYTATDCYHDFMDQEMIFYKPVNYPVFQLQTIAQKA